MPSKTTTGQFTLPHPDLKHNQILMHIKDPATGQDQLCLMEASKCVPLADCTVGVLKSLLKKQSSFINGKHVVDLHDGVATEVTPEDLIKELKKKGIQIDEDKIEGGRVVRKKKGRKSSKSRSKDSDDTIIENVVEVDRSVSFDRSGRSATSFVVESGTTSEDPRMYSIPLKSSVPSIKHKVSDLVGQPVVNKSYSRPVELSSDMRSSSSTPAIREWGQTVKTIIKSKSKSRSETRSSSHEVIDEGVHYVEAPVVQARSDSRRRRGSRSSMASSRSSRSDKAVVHEVALSEVIDVVSEVSIPLKVGSIIEKSDVDIEMETTEVEYMDSYELPVGARVGSSRVIRGDGVVVSRTEIVEEGDVEDLEILNEYEVTEQVNLQKRVVREDIVEHTMVIPDSEEMEEIVDVIKADHKEKKVIVKQVEVPQIVNIYTDVGKVLPSGHIRRQNKYNRTTSVVPRDVKVIEEHVVEQLVEVDEIVYNDIEEVTNVEVPQTVKITHFNDIPVATHVDKYVEVIEEVERSRKVYIERPVGVEAVTEVRYKVPRIKEVSVPTPYQVYVPRFVEVPVNSVQLSNDLVLRSKNIKDRIESLTERVDEKLVSICDIEQLALEAKDHQTSVQGHLDSHDLRTALIRNFVQ